MRAALLCLISGLSSACGVAEGPSIHRGAILGGGAAEDAAVVALEVHRADGARGLCSGVVVAPRVVLTAAHCVTPEAVGLGAQLTVFVGSDLHDPKQADEGDHRMGVDGVVVHPDFELSLLGRGHDLALVWTSRPLPAEPLSLDGTAVPPSESRARVVGYGVSSARPADGSGRRRSAEVSLGRHDERLLELGRGPCVGDSGGPVLVAGGGGERLIGVVSYLEGGGQAMCEAGAKAARLEGDMDFVLDGVGGGLTDGGGCRLASVEVGPLSLPLLLILLWWRGSGPRPRPSGPASSHRS